MITLTNGVQVPENAVQLQTTAAIDGYYVTQPLRLVQYDETLPVAAVQLTYQNQPYIPPAGAELNVRMNKPDGKGVYNPCLGVDSSGIVYFAFTQQMTAAAGDGKLTVEVTDSGVKNSAPIIVNVAENPVQEGSIESADEFLTLQEILAEAEKWGQIVQANAANIQEVIDNLPAIEAAPEAAQQAAASAAAAQQAAQEALGFRTFFSAVIPDSNGNLDPSRPMTVGPATSVQIESKGDRIQSVTALGFTQQAGSGDPSPTNVRQLTNGGLKLVKLVLNDASGVQFQQTTSGGNIFRLTINTPAKANTRSEVLLYTNQLFVPTSYDDRVSQPNQLRAYVEADGTTVVFRPSQSNNWDLSAFTTIVQNMAASGNPLTIWYVPADESQATGLYAPIIIEGGEYRATCLPLTAPLCDGDSVVSWVKSGCDMQVTLDGGTSDGFVYTDLGASGNMRRMRITIPGVFDYRRGRFGFSDWVKYHAYFNATEESFYCGDADSVYLFLKAESLAAAKQILSQKPLTMWLRSTNYTEAADIPVSLETHQQEVLVLDGTEKSHIYDRFFYLDGIFGSEPQSLTSGICSHYRYTVYGSRTIGVALDGQSIIYSPDGDYVIDEEGLTKWKADLAAQYAAGTPVTIVYQLGTRITYAHPAVVIEAATGDQLTYTVTGQSGGTVSVSLKPSQDGGHAKTADNAANAQNADNATQFDGHAWSEVPGQAPVQSVNSKTGAVTLTAADVGAATTAQGQKADSALIFMGFLPNGTAVNSIQNGIWDGDASHRPNPAPDGLNEDLTIVKAGRYLQATDVFGNAKRWNFYSSVWSDPV